MPKVRARIELLSIPLALLLVLAATWMTARGEGVLFQQGMVVRQLQHLAFALEIERRVAGVYPKTLSQIAYLPTWSEYFFEDMDLTVDVWGQKVFYRRVGVADLRNAPRQRSDIQLEESGMAYGYILASCGRDGECSDSWSTGWDRDKRDEDIVIKHGRWIRRPRMSVFADYSTSIELARSEGSIEATVTVRSADLPFSDPSILLRVMGPGELVAPPEEKRDYIMILDDKTMRVDMRFERWQGSLSIRRSFAISGGELPETCVVVVARGGRTEGVFLDNVDYSCAEAE